MSNSNVGELKALLDVLDGLGIDLKLEVSCVNQRDGSRKWLYTTVLKSLTIQQAHSLRRAHPTD